MPVSRRHFIRTTTAALGAAAFPAPVTALATRRVLIVGAGPAGLAAAWELDAAGYDVQVFEARDRAGGRMYTLREPFTDGLYAEAGALYLTGDNPGLDYARTLGLELAEPTVFDPELGTIIELDGQRHVERMFQPVDLPGDLHPDERGKGVFELQSKYIRRPVGALGGLARLVGTGATRPEFAALDRMSLADFVRMQGASDAAIRLMELFYYGSYREGMDVSLLQLASERASMMNSESGRVVVGGNDRICTGMAGRLDDRVHFGRPVRAVDTIDGGVRISIEGPAGRETVEGDFAILTPPPPVLADLEFGRGLSSRTADAIRNVTSVPVTRVWVQTESRPWADEGLSGRVYTDEAVESLAAATGGQPGAGAILEAYTTGRRARDMAARTPEQRVRLLHDAVERYFPGADPVAGGASHAWGDDPWSRGAFVAYEPGRMQDQLSALLAPQGRVYLAGDTVGGCPGYSHSAFWSGRSVAARIMALG